MVLINGLELLFARDRFLRDAAFLAAFTATASDDETKKPLDSQGKQGFLDSRGDTIRTCGLYVPNVKDTPKRTNKNIGKRNTQGDGCTNGCTCDRCLLAIADALKGRLSNDERRKLAVLLLQ